MNRADAYARRELEHARQQLDVTNRELRTCRERLAVAEARCLRGEGALQQERSRHQSALITTAKHHRVIDGLQAERSAQDERFILLCSAHQHTVTNCADRERELAAANTSLDEQLRALRVTNDSNVEQLRALRLDNSALCEHLCSLAEDRDALAKRCDQLEAEKELLEAKVAQLSIDTANLVVLRSHINCLETQSTLQMEELERQRQRERDATETLRRDSQIATEALRRDSQIASEALRRDSQIRIDALAEEVRLLKVKDDQQSAAHERQMSDLRDKTNEEQAKVELKARAWELQWMDATKKLQKEKQHNTPAENAHQAGVESSDDDE